MCQHDDFEIMHYDVWDTEIRRCRLCGSLEMRSDCWRDVEQIMEICKNSRGRLGRTAKRE